MNTFETLGLSRDACFFSKIIVIKFIIIKEIISIVKNINILNIKSTLFYIVIIFGKTLQIRVLIKYYDIVNRVIRSGRR